MPVSRKVGFALMQLNKQFRRCVDQAVSDLDATGVQGMILQYVHMKSMHGTPVYQRDLEHTFMLSRSTVSETLNLLERNGLLQRKPVAHDARLKVLVLTEQAELAIAQITSRIDTLDTEMVQEFTEEELQMFWQLCDKLETAMLHCESRRKEGSNP